VKAGTIGNYYARVAKLLWRNSKRFGTEQLLGLAIALAILFGQFRIGDFSGKPLRPEISAIGRPYLILLAVFLLYQCVKAMPELDKELQSETDSERHQRSHAEQQFDEARQAHQRDHERWQRQLDHERLMANGPALSLAYSIDGINPHRPKPFVLTNTGMRPAYNVRIDPLEIEGHIVMFDLVDQINTPGQAELMPNVEDGSPVFRHDFVRVLEDAYAQREQLAYRDHPGFLNLPFQPIEITVDITYDNDLGQRFKTICQLNYIRFHQTVQVAYIRREILPNPTA
jgi:hypothetical protein